MSSVWWLIRRAEGARKVEIGEFELDLVGDPEAMAKRTPHTLVRTCAPSLSSLSRVVATAYRRIGCGADRHGAKYRPEHRPWPRTTCEAASPAGWSTRRDRRTARTARRCGSRPRRGRTLLGRAL